MNIQDALPNFPEELRKLAQAPDEIPPVGSWHPERVGDIDIHITRAGQWFYQGEVMEREAVVRLFSRIMRREGNDYFLVTPAEKLKISVEGVPFVIRMMDIEGEGEAQQVLFSSNVGDTFALSTQHSIDVGELEDGSVMPLVEVRDGLQARLLPAVYYELADRVVEYKGVYGVWSAGSFHAMA